LLNPTLKIQSNIFLTLTNGKNVIEVNRWSISHTSHYVLWNVKEEEEVVE